MTDPTAPTPQHPAETALFEDTLSCDVVLPVEFTAGHSNVRPGAAEMLLRSVALVEDSRGSDDSEERGDTGLQLQRLEARMDLLLVLMGRLLRASTATLPSLPVRWSRRGLRLDLAQASGVQPGSHGLVRLQPSDWLPDHIELPVTALAEAGDGHGGHHLWLRLDAPGDALEVALERHLFRLHRRQIADARRQR